MPDSRLSSLSYPQIFGSINSGRRIQFPRYLNDAFESCRIPICQIGPTALTKSASKTLPSRVALRIRLTAQPYLELRWTETKIEAQCGGGMYPHYVGMFSSIAGKKT